MGALRTSANWKANGWEQKLHQMWVVDGLSSGQIAKVFGISRGAVLGKLHRLGWTGPRSQNKSQIEGNGGARRARHANANARQFHHNINNRQPTAGDGIKSIAVLPSDPPASERVTFEDLKANQCRWPFEDGTFCGCKRVSVSVSYCADHQARAYYPAKKHGKRVEDYFARIDGYSRSFIRVTPLKRFIP